MTETCATCARNVDRCECIGEVGDGLPNAKTWPNRGWWFGVGYGLGVLTVLGLMGFFGY